MIHIKVILLIKSERNCEISFKNYQMCFFRSSLKDSSQPLHSMVIDRFDGSKFKIILKYRNFQDFCMLVSKLKYSVHRSPTRKYRSRWKTEEKPQTYLENKKFYRRNY